MKKWLNFGLSCIATSLLTSTSLPVLAKDYSSAEIYTADSWLYGKYVLRMRAAEGSGLLSNFFLWKPDSETSDVDWEEVDIEVFGKDGANSWQSNIISTGNGWQTSEQVHTHESSFADDYHTFTLEWTPDYVAWYVDGEELRRSEGDQVDLLKNAAQLRFNFWASQTPSWVGEFDDSILPLNMFVNWVEYYSWNGDGFDLDWRDDFDTFDSNRWSQADWTFDDNYVDFVPANATVSEGYLVLTMTHSGEEGFTGTVPIDSADELDTDTDNDTDTGNETDSDTDTDSGNDTDSDNDTDTGNETDSDTGDDTDNDSDTDTETNTDEDTDSDSDTETSEQASCSYNIVSEWNAGFVAEIIITNTGDTAIESWSVNWQFSDGSTINNLWNAQLSGSSPYNASNLSWNAYISPGQAISFGFVGSKGSSGSSAESVTVSGDICQ